MQPLEGPGEGLERLHLVLVMTLLSTFLPPTRQIRADGPGRGGADEADAVQTAGLADHRLVVVQELPVEFVVLGVVRVDGEDRDHAAGGAGVDEEVDVGVPLDDVPDRPPRLHAVNAADHRAGERFAVPGAGDRLEPRPALPSDQALERLDLEEAEVADAVGRHRDVVRGDAVGIPDGDVRAAELGHLLDDHAADGAGAEDGEGPGRLRLEEVGVLRVVEPAARRRAPAGSGHCAGAKATVPHRLRGGGIDGARRPFLQLSHGGGRRVAVGQRADDQIDGIRVPVMGQELGERRGGVAEAVGAVLVGMRVHDALPMAGIVAPDADPPAPSRRTVKEPIR